ncbi:MAG: DUF3667 domain-containing protein [Adhaeribacter sp.]
MDNFCPNCGQENHDLHVPLSHLLLEVLENTFHFDTKFFRSFGLLLFRPGRLTREFIRNRRAGYVPPFRLYVFISFFYFLLLSSGLGSGEKLAPPLPEEVAGYLPPNEMEAGKRGISSGLATRVLKAPDDQSLDSLIRSEGFQSSPLRRQALRQVSRFSLLSAEEQEHKIIKVVSGMMFLLMPMFALLLKLSYLRRGRYYIEHLIFSVHFHCFAFVLFSADRLLSWLLADYWPELISLAILLLYLFLALRAVYRQNKRKTGLKTVLLSAAYSLVLAGFLLLALLLSVALV